MINSESFVLYESTFKQFERLMNRGKKEQALAFIKATMEFGLYGVIPDDEDEVWDYGLEQTFTSISAAKDRRTAAIENGKKGGRPTVELIEAEVMAKKEELKTWKAVAMYFGVTEQTLRNKRTEWEKQKNPKNLNVNVNVNDNVNENINEKEKDFSSSDEEEVLPQNVREGVEIDSEKMNFKFNKGSFTFTPKVIEKRNSSSEETFNLLFNGVDMNELAAAATPEEKQRAMGF